MLKAARPHGCAALKAAPRVHSPVQSASQSCAASLRTDTHRCKLRQRAFGRSTRRAGSSAARRRLLCRADLVQPDCAETVVLVGDIGGTNCRLVLEKIVAGQSDAILFQKVYPTSDYETFEDALDALYAEEVVQQHPPQSAALAVAGPVIDNVCRMTNLKWVIDGQELTERRGILFAVLNDFEAVGYGVPVVPESDTIRLNDVPIVPMAPKAVLGPGTGLGEAIMVYERSFGGYRVWPSEGSHAAFAPRGWKQRALAAFAEEELGQHCEVEHVACGSGLERICRFLQSDPVEAHLMHSPYDSPSAISKAALSGADPKASEAVDMFLDILGAEAGHMGLRLLAKGGVYICGGITPKLLDRILQGGLLQAFLDRGARFAPILAEFPLIVVTNDQLGLLGARQYALKLLDPSNIACEILAVKEARRHMKGEI